MRPMSLSCPSAQPSLHFRRPLPRACGAALALLFAAAIARADDTLTLDLPPSQAALEARAANMTRQAQAAHTSTLPQKYRTPSYSRTSGGLSRFASRGRFPARGQAASERVVGRLGQLLAATPIHRGRSSRTPLLTTAPTGTYLAIQGEEGAWLGVLMADGSTGWLPRTSAHILDYQVVSNGGPTAPTGSDSGDIYPRSATPYFNGDAQALLNEAYKYLGVRYVWGGNTASGIDCSGFVKNVFETCGYRLPRLGSDQMAYGVPVPVGQLQAGDRLYFGRRTERVGVTHTGLYIGNGYFIHSSSSRHGVAVSHLSEPLFARIYVCARR